MSISATNTSDRATPMPIDGPGNAGMAMNGFLVSEKVFFFLSP
jgi:hypothetical protein